MKLPKGLENILKSQVGTLSRSLALAEGEREAAQTMVRQLENLSRTLQQEALTEKASALRLRDANPTSKENNSTKPDFSHPKVAMKIEELQKTINSKDRSLEQLRRVLKNGNSQKPDPSSQKLSNKVEELKRTVHSREVALEQSRSANDQVKNKLRGEIDELRTETGKMKDVFDSFMRFVNQEDNCPSCDRHWNIKIGHKQNISISKTLPSASAANAATTLVGTMARTNEIAVNNESRMHMLSAESQGLLRRVHVCENVRVDEAGKGNGSVK
jgi:hypothetical protein